MVRATILSVVRGGVISYLVVIGVLLTIVGSAQLWQVHAFHVYASCQATHDRDYDKAQRERADSSFDLNQKRFMYDKSVLKLFDPGNDKKDVARTQRRLEEYITAAEDYFDAVAENPYPESTAELCGTPKG